MWACVGECVAHILRHKAFTEMLMDNISSITHLSEVFLWNSMMLEHPPVITLALLTPRLTK